MRTNKCQNCYSENIEYGKYYLDDDYVVFPWTCEDCHAEGREIFHMEFEENMLDYYPMSKDDYDELLADDRRLNDKEEN